MLLRSLGSVRSMRTLPTIMSASFLALRPFRFRILGAGAALTMAITAIACGSDAGDGGPKNGLPDGGTTDDGTRDGATNPADADAPTTTDRLAERAWEVVSNKGETYLSNVFYADPSQNEQIMPWTLDGHVQIDRLVYPTIGNPNLYTKNDVSDQFMVVLRMDDRAYDYLGATVEPPAAGATLSRVDVGNDPANGFAFFLISRDARPLRTTSTDGLSYGGSTGVYRIYPSDVWMNPIPDDMPESLRKRKTFRFVFKQTTMSKVPPGLYDVRFEMRKDNALYRPPGSPGVYEYQYNAVRVFDDEPSEYSVLNVTDTQVSVGDLYKNKTKVRLDQFVQFLASTNDPNVRDASFITFNGDLHNGGSPGTLRQRPVAWTYNDEAKTILDTLKELPLPIFLTIGNHDGYVATGQVPSAVKAVDTGVRDNLQEVVREATPKAWPNFEWNAYQKYLDDTAAADLLGGYHRDVFTGSFSRQPPPYAKTGVVDSFASSWKEHPREERNEVLYDGFYQWQKTYGPLTSSWKFGKNFYVNLNSFELRQHRRSGWGMYTVNYGGGMSDVQMAWLDRELLRADTNGDDVILLAHHDPRGGHHNLDPGYYYDQLEYGSVYQSAINYIVQDKFNPAVCGLPDWVLPRSKEEDCIHDGLQEWMRADEDFDCRWDERLADSTCDKSLFSSTNGAPAHTYYFSGIELMKRIAQNRQIRTFLLGHTHYNQLEVLQSGDELLPGKITVDGPAAQRFATLEIQNPFRGYAMLEEQRKVAGLATSIRDTPDYDVNQLGMAIVHRRTTRFGELVDPVLAGAPRFLDGDGTLGRELVWLRLVCAADLTSQTYNGTAAFGFSTLHLTKKSDKRAYDKPQINKVTFFVNDGSSAMFSNVTTIDVDRNARLKPHDANNPVEQIYDW